MPVDLTREDDVLGVIAGIILGLVGVAILSAIFGQPRCPRCGRPVQRGTEVCPHCGAQLEW